MESKYKSYWRADPLYKNKLREIAPCSPKVYYFLESLSDTYDIYCASDMIRYVSSNNPDVLETLNKINYNGYGHVKLIK